MLSFLKGLAAPIIGAGGQILSGLFSAKSAQKGQESANETNIRLAQEERRWLERMSNTAHQREVADLRKADLNPILSAKYGGASTPPISSARVHSTTEKSSYLKQQAMQNAMNSIVQASSAKLLNTQVDTEGTKQDVNRSTAVRNYATALGGLGFGAHQTVKMIKEFMRKGSKKVVGFSKRAVRHSAKSLALVTPKQLYPEIYLDYQKG